MSVAGPAQLLQTTALIWLSGHLGFGDSRQQIIETSMDRYIETEITIKCDYSYIHKFNPDAV
jgi:hypothetical protein